MNKDVEIQNSLSLYNEKRDNFINSQFYYNEFVEYLNQNWIDTTYHYWLWYDLTIKDFKKGNSFFFTPNSFILSWMLKRDFFKSFQEYLNFHKNIHKDDINKEITDEFEIMRVYNRVNNSNPYIHKKYHLFLWIILKNKRTKEIINLSEEQSNHIIDLIDYLHFNIIK